MLNKVYLISCFYFCVLTCTAQLSIEGKVISSVKEGDLSEVEVFLVEEDEIQKKDFKFVNLKEQSYTLIVFALGFESSQVVIDLKQDTSLLIRLKPLAEQLSEITIQDQNDYNFTIKQLRAVEGTSIFSGKKTEVIQMQKIQGNLGGNNSRQIYAQISGLNIFEGNDGGLQLAIGGRGLDPNRTSNFNTRQNGYDISADVLGYPESYYTPPAEALDEIQIIRGAASLQYGTQFGGLINFKTHSIPYDKKLEIVSNQTVGSFGFFNSFNSIGLNKGKWSINGFFNFKKGQGYRDNSDFSARNFFLNVNYRINKKTSLKLEASTFNYLAQQAGGLTDEQFALDPRQSNRERNWFHVDWKLYNAVLSHKINTRSRLTLSLFALDASRSAIGFRGNPIDLNQNPITSIDEKNNNGEFTLPRDLIKGDFNNFGAEIRFLNRYKIKDTRAIFLIGSKFYQARNTSIQGPGSRGRNPNFDLTSEQFKDYPNQSNFTFPNRNLALFSEQIFYINENFSITPGLRFEHIKTEAIGDYQVVQFDIAGNAINNALFEEQQSFARNFFLMGLGISYKTTESTKIYSNISQNYRSVTFSDIRTVNPTFIIDPNISDENGYTFDLGFKGKSLSRISYDLGIYSVFYNDRIGIILDDRANRVRKNIGNALIYGLETLVEFNLIPEGKKNLSFYSNLALTESLYTSSNEKNIVGNKVEFVPFVNIRSGLKGGIKHLTSSIQFTYISSQFTDVGNTIRREAGDSRSGIIGRIPSYHVLDWSVFYELKRFSLRGGVNNLLNASYFTRRASGYPGPGIIPSDGRNYYLTIGFRI